MAKHYIRASLLAKMIPCTSTEETRAYLKGVFIAPEGLLVATNGYVMGVQKLNPGIDCSLDFVATLAGRIVNLPKPGTLKDTKHLTAWVEIDHENGHLTVHQENAETWEAMTKRLQHPVPNIAHIEPRSCFIDGTFPDWRRVVPRDCTEVGTGEAAISSLLFEKISTFLSVGDRMGTAIKAFHSIPGKMGDYGALVFRSCPNAFMVVMPIRRGTDTPSEALPEWFTKPRD